MKKRLATYAASNLLSGVASLLSVLVLARLLPPEQYGEYVTVLVVAALCQTAGFSWLHSSLIRLHAEETDENGRTRFAAAVLIGFILSAVVVVVVWTIGLVVLRLWSVDLIWLGVAGLSVLLSTSWAAMAAWAGTGWRHVTGVSRSPGAAGVRRPRDRDCRAGLAAGDPLVALAAIAVTSLLAAAIARFPVHTALRHRRQSQPRLREIWAYGAPVTGASLGYMILAASDRLLIAGSLGPAAAGAYAAASGIASRALGLLLPPIALAVRPQLFLEFSQRGSGARATTDVPHVRLADRRRVARHHSLRLRARPAGIADHWWRTGRAPRRRCCPGPMVGAFMSAFLTLHFAMAISDRPPHQMDARSRSRAGGLRFDILAECAAGCRGSASLPAGWSDRCTSHCRLALLLAIAFVAAATYRVPVCLLPTASAPAADLRASSWPSVQLEFRKNRVGGSRSSLGRRSADVHAACAFRAQCRERHGASCHGAGPEIQAQRSSHDCRERRAGLALLPRGAP